MYRWATLNFFQMLRGEESKRKKLPWILGMVDGNVWPAWGGWQCGELDEASIEQVSLSNGGRRSRGPGQWPTWPASSLPKRRKARPAVSAASAQSLQRARPLNHFTALCYGMQRGRGCSELGRHLEALRASTAHCKSRQRGPLAPCSPGRGGELSPHCREGWAGTWPIVRFPCHPQVPSRLTNPRLTTPKSQNVPFFGGTAISQDKFAETLASWSSPKRTPVFSRGGFQLIKKKNPTIVSAQTCGHGWLARLPAFSPASTT